MIKPIFKQKRSSDDPDNYKGITIVSCFGTIFASVINNRLVEYFDENSTIGSEQAQFRAGHSTVDHLLPLRCIIDFFLPKKKRLYCLFVDYVKAFDRVKRAFLWQKLLDFGVNGRVLPFIKDMYQKAKSCVKVGEIVQIIFNVIQASAKLKPVTNFICHLFK